MIKSIIFDMDGVLIDAKEWHYESLNKALRNFGYEISRHDHLTTYDGLPTRKKLQMLTREVGLSASLHEFINELKQKYTMQIVNSHCSPSFLHEYAIARLKNEGYHLAVASNAVKNSVKIMLEKACLLEYMDFFLSNEDVSKGKPNPEIYSTAISKFGLTPEECLIVEDNENGIKAAKGSGAHVLVVDTVDDVSYENLASAISRAEKGVQR